MSMALSSHGVGEFTAWLGMWSLWTTGRELSIRCSSSSHDTPLIPRFGLFSKSISMSPHTFWLMAICCCGMVARSTGGMVSWVGVWAYARPVPAPSPPMRAATTASTGSIASTCLPAI